jgi:ABC-type multidrug transport system fused ATPase/permease subunit
VVLVCAPLVSIVYRVMGKGAQKRSLAVQESTGSLTGLAAENYSAQAVVKIFGLQQREAGRFRRGSNRLFDSERRLSLFGGIFGVSVNLIVTMLRLFVLGFGAWLIVEGHFTVGGLVAFLGIMGEVLSPVTILTTIGQEVQAATGALVRINEVLDATPEPDATDRPVLAPLATEVRLVDLTFSYTSERRVLDNVNAVIPAGKRVAFVGPSGSGKSTVLQLLMRLYDPDEGSVLFDGVDITDVQLDSLRGQLGVVFQDSFLFNTSVKENIALGHEGASDDEIRWAAEAAEVHDFIESMPRGYSTVVGERGGLLSGGQRQRLAIARALVRNPRVLLLDEATSALDPRTERQITDTLNRIAEGRTTIAITHRLTSVVDYDLIFVIVDGRIVESGTHAELLASQGAFARLWAEQTGQPLPTEAELDIAAALARVSIFSHLDAGGLQAVASRMTSGQLNPGDSVPEGGGRLLMVARGRAVVRAPSVGGEMQVSAELEPGDVFGLSALLGSEVGLQLEAVEPVTLLVLGDEAIAGIAATYPTVASALVGGAGGPVVPAAGRRLSRATFVGR